MSAFTRAATVLRDYAAMIEDSEINHSGPNKGRCDPHIEAEVAEYRELAKKLDEAAAPPNQYPDTEADGVVFCGKCGAKR